mmetsp:Transcript_19796/g.61012  ORF Transcript_19796/g.61012 Transcript_19796/m.61012 type:complete len:284 (-) Transcript_19796:319-1170(-)
MPPLPARDRRVPARRLQRVRVVEHARAPRAHQQNLPVRLEMVLGRHVGARMPETLLEPPVVLEMPVPVLPELAGVLELAPHGRRELQMHVAARHRAVARLVPERAPARLLVRARRESQLADAARKPRQVRRLARRREHVVRIEVRDRARPAPRYRVEPAPRGVVRAARLRDGLPATRGPQQNERVAPFQKLLEALEVARVDARDRVRERRVALVQEERPQLRRLRRLDARRGGGVFVPLRRRRAALAVVARLVGRVERVRRVVGPEIREVPDRLDVVGHGHAF